ncbi:MAG: hypothetical protein KF774_01145 [Planctomyces sp.]|nr:hypothetical protein [Planctomyces sp.]
MTRLVRSLALGLLLAAASRAAYAEEGAGPAEENRSPLGINLSGVVDWSTEYPFVDVFRMSRAWVSNAEGKPWGQGGELDVDERGWVRQLAPGQFATTLILTSPGYPTGQYVCLYDGDGMLRIDSQRVVESQPGRLVVEVGDRPGLLLHIRRTNPENPVRNIRFLMPGCEETHQSQPFYKPFLERTKRFPVLRFMDWMQTNGSRQEQWSDRPRPDDANQSRGVCLEHMLDLCNELGVDPWFCMPHRADDEYVREFARLVWDRLELTRRVYVEHSNEVWNFGFEQARYAAAEGKRLQLSDNEYQGALRFHSRRSVAIFKIWDEEFGDSKRLVRVLGSHSANPWASEQVVGFEDAAQHADALAIAPYFGHSLGDPKNVEATLRGGLDGVFEECRRDIRRNGETIRRQADVAAAHGLELIAYEGGQHLVGHGGAENNTELTELLQAANRDPRMRELYAQDLAGWKANGGRLFVVFASPSQYSKWGSWGILEREDQPLETAPKHQALLEFAETNPRWWTPER